MEGRDVFKIYVSPILAAAVLDFVYYVISELFE
jgi:hypothetical protein